MTTDKIAIKQKLLKLLNVKREHGNSEAEVAFAMASASRLMIAHGISADELQQSKAIAGKSELVELDTDWQEILADCAGNLFGCMTLFTKNAIKTPVFYYIGRPENHDAAKATFEYLCSQVEYLYKANLPRGLSQSTRANFRRTFKYAYFCRVYHRAEELIAEMKRGEHSKEIAGGTALVVQGHLDKLADEVDDFLKKSGMNIRTKKSRSRSSGVGTAAGHMAGNSVNLRGALS